MSICCTLPEHFEPVNPGLQTHLSGDAHEPPLGQEVEPKHTAV